jgi:hypothetical protein
MPVHTGADGCTARTAPFLRYVSLPLVRGAVTGVAEVKWRRMMVRRQLMHRAAAEDAAGCHPG